MRTKGVCARLRLLVVVAIFSAVVVLSGHSVALAKSYSISQVTVHGVVTPNASLMIKEDRTFDFSGDFSEVHWKLLKKDAGAIDIISVTDSNGVTYKRTEDPATESSRPEGEYLVTGDASSVEVFAFHRTSNAQRTFTITYRVANAAKRWEDTGELYWQLIGSEWAVPTAKFDAAIRVEGVRSNSEVKAWAHGPLNGLVTIAQDGTVHLTAKNIPANTFVEVREMFPADALSQAPVQPQKQAAAIMSQEAAAANAANRQRLAARAFVGAWLGGSGLLALGGLIFGIWAFVRFGREYRAQFQGQYFREDPRPDLHPAVVGALWRFGRVEDVDIAATLMDLADKGVITMAPIEANKGGLAGVFGGKQKTFVLTRVAEKQDKMTSLDRQLLDILFGQVAGGGDSLIVSEIEGYAKAHPQSFSEDIKGWKAAAQAEAEQLGFFEPSGRAWQIGVFMLAVAVAVVGIFGTAQTGSAWPAVMCVPVALVLAGIGIFMNRRSNAGNELYRQYVALRDFLKDFSRLHEAPPASVILWNRFLVLAVVFGIAEEVIEQLRVKMPEVVQDARFQTTYWWVYAGGYGHSPVGDLSRSFGTAAAAASSAMSSASGGGGGFSGGGGFGGGGGGGGAS